MQSLIRTSGLVLCIAFALFLFPDFARAADILNINVENAYFYDNLGLYPGNGVAGRNTLPTSCYRLEKSGLNSSDSGCPVNDSGNWTLNPIASITAKFLVGSEDEGIILGSSGLKYYKGNNIFLFADGSATYSDRFAFYYQLKQIEAEQVTQSQIFRAYAKIRFGKWAIEAGKDNVALGVGEYGGLLLSSHAEPYPLVKLATEEPMDFLGKWDFTIMNGWLIAPTQKDPANSNVLAMRLTYSPASWLELGGTKITHFGGAGRPLYQPGDYFTVATGLEQRQTSGNFENQGLLSADITLRLPLDLLFPSVKSFTIYDEEAAADPQFWFQSTAPGVTKPGFVDWNEPSDMWGMTLAFEDDFFRLEYYKTCVGMYLHSAYPYDGYAYQDVSLGAITGTNSRSMILSHMHRFSGQTKLRYQIGYYEDPKFTEPLGGVSQTQMYRDFITLEPQGTFGPYTLSLYMRYDRTTNYDTNFLPNQYTVVPDSKDIYTVMVSATRAF
jgi:hypothetical protein